MKLIYIGDGKVTFPKGVDYQGPTVQHGDVIEPHSDEIAANLIKQGLARPMVEPKPRREKPEPKPE